MKKRINWKNEIFNMIIVITISIALGMGLHVFVYKADFAPSGVDGIATMLQYGSQTLFKRQVNAGIFTFALNLPLLIAAWFILKKRYVIYTIIYTIVISITLVVVDKFNLPQYDCTIPGTSNSHLVAAIFGGLIQGLSGILLRIGGSAGGVDIIGCMFQKKMQHIDVERFISYASYVVVAVSFFVYGNINSVCLSIVEIFVCEKVTSVILKSNRSAVKFEIITDNEHLEEIKSYIIYKIRHGATIINSEGLFSGEDKQMIICLINYRQVPEFLKKIKTIPNTFLYYSDAKGIRGNFDFNAKTDGKKNKAASKAAEKIDA